MVSRATSGRVIGGMKNVGLPWGLLGIEGPEWVLWELLLQEWTKLLQSCYGNSGYLGEGHRGYAKFGAPMGAGGHRGAKGKHT